MASLTLDQAAQGAKPPQLLAKALSGTLVAGRPFSFWAIAGAPGAGAYNGTLNGVTLSSSSAVVPGQIFTADPAAGSAYLHRLQAQLAQAGTLILADRIWHNGGISATLTTAQAITSPTWPARCPTSAIDDGASTNGLGVMLAVEVSAATGAGSPTITISYTNSDGVAGRTATNVIATAATSAAGSTFLIGRQADDRGVRSVQSITLSATWTSGTINLVAFRPIVTMEIGAQLTNAVDYLTSAGPKLYNGKVPYLVFVPTATTTTSVVGSYAETSG